MSTTVVSWERGTPISPETRVRKNFSDKPMEEWSAAYDPVVTLVAVPALEISALGISLLIVISALRAGRDLSVGIFEGQIAPLLLRY